MKPLSGEPCEACRSDSPQVTRDEIEAFAPLIPEWKIVEHDGIMKLERTYRFKDFAQALAFTRRVGELAEEASHHPAILTEYGKATVTWWTHAIKGLHRNDFILAARTDEVA